MHVIWPQPAQRIDHPSSLFHQPATDEPPTWDVLQQQRRDVLASKLDTLRFRREILELVRERARYLRLDADDLLSWLAQQTTPTFKAPINS
ncbi:hypothetical protein [Andreprevotia chitinilytica]|uniref:hypothetical protein n=1 Tax=Andreprevotia chitinilytica TaxID=396808 RepID=UPI00147049A4|nr:hypothetical protein [Andreprevotia chitinilytica]